MSKYHNYNHNHNHNNYNHNNYNHNNLSLYTQLDINDIKKNIELINENVKKNKNILFKPTLRDKQKICDIILAYIKQNNRKIYGGYAINQLVINKNKNAGFYTSHDIPDIDFYSIDPNTDIINLCNILVDAGFNRVNGREAKHKHTYSIFVEYDLYCDITYVPKNIYNKIPIKIINNIYYVHPDFITIDYLRIVNDPVSYWRLEKSLSRLQLLHQYYPPTYIKDSIYIGETENDEHIAKCIDSICDFLTDKTDIIVVGFYAYNYFLSESKYYKKNKNITNIDNLPYIEFISKNYISDSKNIIELLKEQFGEDISYTEYHPFFMYLGNFVDIYLNGDLICIIYDYDKRCLMYQTICLKLNNLESDKKINIGTFSLTLLYSNINALKYKICNNKELMTLYNTMSSHLIQFKSYFLNNTNKSTLDEHMFKDFIADFIGPDVNPDHEILLKYEKRREKNKPSMFIYDPHKNRKEEKEKNFFFPNISGNEIKNPKHQKLNNKTENESIESIDSDISDESDREEDNDVVNNIDEENIDEIVN